jgi:hypothetical protein
MTCLRGMRQDTYLPFLHLKSQSLCLLLQLALPLLALLDVALEFRLQLLTRGLELLKLRLERLVLRLVVRELLLNAAPSSARGRGGRVVGHGERGLRCDFGGLQISGGLRGVVGRWNPRERQIIIHGGRGRVAQGAQLVSGVLGARVVVPA